MEKTEKQGSTIPMAGVNQFREMLYLFLSRAFSNEADKAFLEDASKIMDSLEDLSELGEFSEETVQSGKQFIQEFLNQIKEKDQEKVLIDLSRDYAASFLGVGGKTAALCESVYQGQIGSLFQDSYFDVKDRYRAINLEKSGSFSEPDDHLSVELAYMAKLCRLIIESDGNGTDQLIHYLKAQQQFIQKHLILWVPSFVERLKEVSSSMFYNSLGCILDGYMKMDAGLIDSLIEDVESLNQI